MPDICMCLDHICPSRHLCYRYSATPNPNYQDYGLFDRKGKQKCERFIEKELQFKEDRVDSKEDLLHQLTRAEVVMFEIAREIIKVPGHSLYDLDSFTDGEIYLTAKQKRNLVKVWLELERKDLELHSKEDWIEDLYAEE